MSVRKKRAFFTLGSPRQVFSNARLDRVPTDEVAVVEAEERPFVDQVADQREVLARGERLEAIEEGDDVVCGDR